MSLTTCLHTSKSWNVRCAVSWALGWLMRNNAALLNRYQIVIEHTHSPALNDLAGGVYAGRIQPTHTLNFNNEKERHSFRVKLKRQIKNVVVVSLSSALIAPLGASTAQAANYSIDHLKLYAHSRIVNYKEFLCFNRIISKESAWSYTAHNGSHWGLGQMKSTYYRDLDPFRQIDQTLKYITKRYNTPCQAWEFHKRKNWF